MDWVNNKIYWTDSYTKLIEVSELDGSNRLALVWSNMELPRPIVLDPFNRSVSQYEYYLIEQSTLMHCMNHIYLKSINIRLMCH